MMKIIVFGPHGLLGEACCRMLSQYAEVIPVGRDVLDLAETTKLTEFLGNTDYDVIVNAAAMTSLEGCLDNQELAELVNIEAPAAMARSAAQKNASLIHISTDYVFSGNVDTLCDENMEPDPVNVYGVTKAEGEKRVLELDGSALVARVSWIFGKGRESFVDQLVQAAKEGHRKPCIGDKYSIPNYADDLALGLWLLIEKKATGVVHLCSDSEPESWYSYGEKVLETSKKLGIITNEQNVLERQYLAEAHFFREPRPKHTAMTSARLKSEFGIHLRDWQEGLVCFLSSF